MGHTTPGLVRVPMSGHPGGMAPPAPVARSPRTWHRRAGGVLPGLLLSALVAGVAVEVARAAPVLSPALIAILAGAVAANAGLLPERLRPGLDVAARTVLRLGIVLLGLQLVLGDVWALGPVAVVLVLAVVALGMVTGLACGRVLRIPWQQTVLITCGFSICGAAAVAAAEGVLIPDRRPGEAPDAGGERLRTQTATAVALVVVFGTVMIPALPLAAHGLGLAPRTAGLWAGASIHEVAQVVAAGSLLGHGALGVAVLEKLGRVLLLAPVIAVVGARERRRAAGAASTGPRRRLRPVPLFVLGFLAAVVLASTGAVPAVVLAAARPVQTLCMAAAMFALGTGVRVRLLRQVGGRPVVLAVILTLVVAAAGLLGALLA